MVLYPGKRLANILLGVCVLLGSTGWTVAQMGPPITADKKLIGFACNTVEPGYLREHVADLEQLPLDGLNIFVYPDDWGPKRTGQEGMFFGGRRFTRGDFGKALGDLKATRFQRLTDNFIQVEMSARGSAVTGNPGDGNLGWFDPNWSGIAVNGAVVAWLAREAGFKGLFLDVEHYSGSLGPWRGESIFNYAASPSSDQHSLQETAAQIELRGRQWMRAVAQVYPEITIILIQNTGWQKNSQVRFFVRGMLQARGKATLIDGGEGGYYHVTHPEFASLRNTAESAHATDELFAPIQYAMGLWVDPTPDKYGGWHTQPADFDKNYRSPRELEQSLYGALTVTDKYVWLYTWHAGLWFNPVKRSRLMKGQCRLCPHDTLPPAYLQALKDCRRSHDLSWTPAVAADRQFYFDDAVLVQGEAIADNSTNLLANPGFEQWTAAGDSHPVGWQVGGEGTVIVRETKRVKSGNYAIGLTTDLTRGHVLIDMRLPAARFAGKTITFGTWVNAGLAEAAGVEILDFVQDMHEVSPGAGHPGDGKWHFVTVTRMIRPAASGQVVFRLSAHVPYVKRPAGVPQDD